MAKQQRPFAPVRDGILEHHARMTWAEIAVFSHLLNRANRTARAGRVGLCAGLTGNKLAKDMRKSREATQRALSGLSSTKGPHGKRGRYIEVTPEGIIVLNFETNSVPSGPDASALARIPAGRIPAGGASGPDPSRPYSSRVRTGSQPAPGRIPAGSGLDPSRATLLRDGDVSEDVDDPCGASSAAGDPVVFWDNEKEALSIDEEWLRGEIVEYQEKVGVVLTRKEYELEARRLELELLRDTRRRACIKLASNGKPSSAKQFKMLRTYTLGRFKEAIQRKHDRSSKQSSRPAAVEQAETYLRRGHDEAKADKARMDACKLDHSSSSGRLKGADVWFCVDKCGWTERLPEALRWKPKKPKASR